MNVTRMPTITKQSEGRTIAVVGDVYRFLATGQDTDSGRPDQGDDWTPMNPRRITIIPFIHGKLTRDGTISEPNIYWIMEKWLERHPEIKTRTLEIRVSRGTMTLPHGEKTDLIRATILVGEDIEGCDPAQDLDLYEYFLSDDQGDREPSQKG